MPTTNYDSSLLTKRRRAVALNTFYTFNNASIATGASVRREQPDTQLSEVTTQRHETKANTNPSNPCPCSTATTVNLGGANGKNVG